VYCGPSGDGAEARPMKNGLCNVGLERSRPAYQGDSPKHCTLRLMRPTRVAMPAVGHLRRSQHAGDDGRSALGSGKTRPPRSIRQPALQ